MNRPPGTSATSSLQSPLGPSYQNLSCGSVTWHELGEIVGRGGGAVPWGVGTAVGGGTEAVVVAAGRGVREGCGKVVLDRLGAGGAIATALVGALAEGVDATFSGAP